MQFMRDILASVLSVTAVVAVLAFLGRSWVDHLFDRKLEAFSSRLGLDSKARELALASQIQFKERQLAAFYGPIYAILKSHAPLVDLHRRQQLDPIRSKVIPKIIAGNMRIVRILRNRSHLIDGSSIPESFIRFQTHVTIWHAYIESGHGGVPMPETEFPEAYFPRSFADEITATTERLKRELDVLYQSYGFVSNEGRPELALPRDYPSAVQVVLRENAVPPAV